MPGSKSLALLVTSMVLMLAIVPPAGAQVHERSFGDYVVRSNVIASMFLDPTIAQRHRISRAKDRAVLNVVVLSDPTSPRSAVRATVGAQVAARGGATVPVRMHEVAENEGVSYIGTFEMVPGKEAEVTIVVRPHSSGQTLEMTYKDTMPSG